MTDQTTELVYVDNEEEARELEELIRSTEGVESQRESTGDGFAPLIIIAIIGGAALVGGIIDYWSEKKKGGQVIDLTPGADPWVYRSKGVIYGLVLVRAADGKTVSVDVKEPKGFFLKVVEAVITAVQGVAEKTVDAVKSAATAAAGDKAEVKVTDTPVPAPDLAA